jgi:para-nitrobenzyl esterase
VAELTAASTTNLEIVVTDFKVCPPVQVYIFSKTFKNPLTRRPVGDKLCKALRNLINHTTRRYVMKRFTALLLIALVLLSTIAVSCAPASAPLKDPIKIDTGLVSGATVGEKQDIHVYKGIPFAAPPVGYLRWKPPQLAAPWQGVKECTEFGPAPMGYYSVAFKAYAKTISEDCLYLNVWTPAKMTSDRMPVMVWIYGGAFRFGEGSNPGYNGENLARHGVVLVTFNYRVGPLGFLAHPLLSKEDEHNSSGNYGLLDQIAALQWVHKNIAAFGGDPNRVTIFGESAGGTSVMFLMSSPLSEGLFQRAISQSAYESNYFAHLWENMYGNEPKEKMGEQLAKDLGCDTAPDPIACMRAKSAQEVMDKGKPPTAVYEAGYRYEPCVDGWAVPDLPPNVFAAGKQHNVPLIIGSNSDEWALFQLLDALLERKSVTADSYQTSVKNMFGDKAQQVLTMYPANDDKEAKASDEQVWTLFTFTCPAKFYASAMSNVNSKAYFYQFSRVPLGASAYGAVHATDVVYAFGTLLPLLTTPKPETYYDDTDRALSDAMMSYWTGFAATGDPNQEGLAKWPVYDAKTGQYLDLGDTIQVKSGINTEACDLCLNSLKEKRSQ